MPSMPRSSSSSSCRPQASLRRSHFGVVAGRNDKSGKPPPNAPAGETSKRIRQQKGLTEERLADLSGVSQPTLAALSRAGANPTAVSLYELATALGVSHVELVRSARGRVACFRAKPGRRVDRIAIVPQLTSRWMVIGW